MQPTVQLGWVLPSVMESLKGVTKSALEGKRKTFKLREGYHWKKAEDNKIYWHFERYNDYVENGSNYTRT